MTKDASEITAEPKIVYIRPLREDEVPEAREAGARYSIHDEAGNRIGVAQQREAAFIAAREHNLSPHAVH